mgnify:CR=1 FL=1
MITSNVISAQIHLDCFATRKVENAYGSGVYFIQIRVAIVAFARKSSVAELENGNFWRKNMKFKNNRYASVWHFLHFESKSSTHALYLDQNLTSTFLAKVYFDLYFSTNHNQKRSKYRKVRIKRFLKIWQMSKIIFSILENSGIF